jgi:Na+/melibiose symporter-like transporter
MLLFAVLVLQLTASGMSYASLAYLFTFNLRFEEPLTVLGIFVLITSVLAIVAQPLWVAIANRLGKRIGLLIASIGFGLTLLSVLLIPERETTPAYLVAVGMGLFNSGCYLNIYAMLTDIVERDKRDEGLSRAGAYSGLFTAGDKIAFAIGGTLLAGSILGAAGFAPGTAVQTAEAEAGILFAFSVAPGGLFILTCAIIFFIMREPASLSARPA